MLETEGRLDEALLGAFAPQDLTPVGPRSNVGFSRGGRDLEEAARPKCKVSGPMRARSPFAASSCAAGGRRGLGCLGGALLGPFVVVLSGSRHRRADDSRHAPLFPESLDRGLGLLHQELQGAGLFDHLVDDRLLT